MEVFLLIDAHCDLEIREKEGVMAYLAQNGNSKKASLRITSEAKSLRRGLWAEEREHLSLPTFSAGMATDQSALMPRAEPDAGSSDKEPFSSVTQGESP